MTTFYTWTDITVPDKVNKGAFRTIPVGTEVTKADVGDDWSDFRAAGVIRPTKYPEGVLSTESPRNAILRKANEAMKAASEPYKHELEA